MNECNTVKARESQAREWLLKGGGGHEGGADGLCALTVTGEGLVEFLAAYKEDFEREIRLDEAKWWKKHTGSNSAGYGNSTILLINEGNYILNFPKKTRRIV